MKNCHDSFEHQGVVIARQQKMKRTEDIGRTMTNLIFADSRLQTSPLCDLGITYIIIKVLLKSFCSFSSIEMHTEIAEKS